MNLFNYNINILSLLTFNIKYNPSIETLKFFTEYSCAFFFSKFNFSLFVYYLFLFVIF